MMSMGDNVLPCLDIIAASFHEWTIAQGRVIVMLMSGNGVAPCVDCVAWRSELVALIGKHASPMCLVSKQSGSKG